jgi:uncharacterized protein
MTRRLAIRWPDPQLFARREERPYRILAVSDEEEPALTSEPGPRNLGPIEVVIGCGDLEPPYLSFVTDAFGVPLVYVRGNHDAGGAWRASERRLLPEQIRDGALQVESGLRVTGFSGSPRYSGRGVEVSAGAMWLRVLRAWPRLQRNAPLLVISHAAPRGLNDAPDHAHRGFTAFRWLVDRLAPPLWLHGHTALVRRGLDDRIVRNGPTVHYNCTAATLIELVP